MQIRSSTRRFSKAFFDALETRQLMTAIVSYDFAGNTNGHEASESASTVSGVTATAFARGTANFPAPSWGNNANSFISAPLQVSGSQNYGNSEATAVTKGHYFTFSATPAAGKKLSISSVDFSAFMQTIPPGGDFAIRWSTNGGSSWTSGSTPVHSNNTWNSITQQSLSVGLTDITTTVDFRLVVYNAAAWSLTGLGNYSGADVIVQGSVSDVTPAAPSGLTTEPNIHALGNLLAWTDNSTIETGYVVERAPNSTFSSGVATFNLAANATSYEDTTPAVGTRYWYRVRAVNGGAASSNSTSSSVRTIHIYEQWGQQTWRTEFSGHPEYIRPTSYDFDTDAITMGGHAWDPYGAWEPTGGNQGIPDVGNLDEDAIADAAEEVGTTGLLLNDIEVPYDFYSESTDPEIEAMIDLQIEFAEIARDANPDVKLGIYVVPPYKFPWFSPTQVARWEAVSETVIDALIQPGVLYDFAATPIYMDGTNSTSYGQMLAARQSMIDKVEEEGGQIIPYFSTRSLFGTIRELTSSELEDAAELIADCGYQAIRWDGPEVIWTSASQTSQASLLSHLQTVTPPADS